MDPGSYLRMLMNYAVLVGGLIVLAMVLFYRASVPHDQRSGHRLAVCVIMYGWVFAVVIMGQRTFRIAS